MTNRMTIATANDRQTRIRASIVAQAMGDAMGYAVEFNRSVTPRNVRVRSPFDALEGDIVARFSDDTQMAYAVADALTRDDVRTSEEAAVSVALRIAEWYDSPLGGTHRAPGNACSMGARALIRMRDAGTIEEQWHLAGKPDGKGCGIVMRSAPFGWLDCAPRFAAELSAQTHRSPCARAQGAAMTAAVARAIECPEDPFEVAQSALYAAVEEDEYTARLIQEAMYAAQQRRVIAIHNVEHALDIDCDVLGKWEGWRGDEAIAAALYCFLVHPQDIRSCLVLAANTIGDSDSLAAVAGAVAGAYLGEVPEEWLPAVECLDELLDVADACARRSAPEDVFGEEPETETETI